MKIESGLFALCGLIIFSISHAQHHVFGTSPSEGPVNSVPSVTKQRKQNTRKSQKGTMTTVSPTEPTYIDAESTVWQASETFVKNIPTGVDCYSTAFDCVPRTALQAALIDADRNCAIGSMQAKMEVLEHPGENSIGIKLSVAGRQLMVITSIGIEDSHLLLNTILEDELQKKGKVRFKVDRNAKSFNDYADEAAQFKPRFSVTKRIEGSEKAREISANGVKQGNKEYLYIPFTLTPGYTKEDVELAIKKGQIRVGLTTSAYLTTTSTSMLSEQVGFVPEIEDEVYLLTCKDVNYHLDLYN